MTSQSPAGMCAPQAAGVQKAARFENRPEEAAMNDRQNVARQTPVDPILALRGVGRELWRDEGADAYVSRLREGWS